ncbi:MBL fold metallo-hydrolase [Cognatiyoonia sp. IB215182]|uniref:MBL fold metallo-hydrolase n=1 Tax=Cognatiyoonia sp. IB215182 TaxID=3097353 RepID=UPI002A14F517|nr:MBL fold metallo-hydrolase [Cognatiyoonia sp. IB215182]MDX8353552.1 MBL fold metallo-hydrolase [Cognatiyoonia sp. IB215182]
MTDAVSYPVGVPVQLAPDLHCVLAPNPSPMTFWGTNTYLIGAAALAVVDPGPADMQHLDALLAAIAGRPVTHILVTHSHLDHSPLARPLSEVVNAPILAFGDAQAGRSHVMTRLAAAGLTGGGEGIDADFVPDECLSDQAIVNGPWGTIRAVHTPGHLGNHLSFQWRQSLFSGDHVMGWASSLVSPPDGDLTDFMLSCQKLSAIDATTYFPAHGPAITDPKTRLAWLVGHRKDRETQILDQLSLDDLTVSELTRRIYVEVAPALLPAAERNVFAHLVDLTERGIIDAWPTLAFTAQYHRR